MGVMFVIVRMCSLLNIISLLPKSINPVRIGDVGTLKLFTQQEKKLTF